MLIYYVHTTIDYFYIETIFCWLHEFFVAGPYYGSKCSLSFFTEIKLKGFLLFWYAGSQHKFVKQRIDAIDKENFTYRYTIIEGDVLTNTFESISYHVKIVASPDGGSICKTRSIYTTKGDAHISEDEIKAGKEKASQIIKAIEAYLLANPDYCWN